MAPTADQVGGLASTFGEAVNNAILPLLIIPVVPCLTAVMIISGANYCKASEGVYAVCPGDMTKLNFTLFWVSRSGC